jgi:dihydrofolate reductase
MRKKPSKEHGTIEIIYSVASSLDGYIATIDGSVDWLSRFHGSAADSGAGDLEASADALLLGSRTYEFALKLGHWPSPDKPSWVFTKRNLKVLHPSITLTAQRPREVAELLAARGMRRAWLMGGGKLAASFHGDGLISRYIISVFPILLGSGVAVFAPHPSRPETLRLVSAKPFKSGIVQLTYDRSRNR